MEIAQAIAQPWEIVAASSRTFRALYYHPVYGWCVAQLLQRKGFSSVEVGVVRESRVGGAEQLKAYSLSTAEIVVWLGLVDVPTPLTWEFTL